MKTKKYHKTPTGFEDELKAEPVNYDVKNSYQELVKMFELVKIKFENHMELAGKEKRISKSLYVIYQTIVKAYKSLEKLHV
ncbi:MAG: hypothetical protein HOG34_00790 [Bacteroidetes bacterium]|jgi:hypothetical protein|nr:hypothetical protein [Bacteroidota bacterium]MBT4399384.1 hypothetical protein [Bacteroidota bacterium]